MSIIDGGVIVSTTLIYDIYNRQKTPNRDQVVLDRINLYMSKNVHSLTDGMIRNTTVIPADTRDYIAAPYNIGSKEWSEITKSNEFPMMKRLASNLKLGLLISYCETKDQMFLNFFMIIAYTSLMSKYFKNGYDRNVMKYTIDMSDGRTDFKKYEGSLIIVANKKVETFVQQFKRQLDTKTPTDKQLREWIQSLTTRMNDSVKLIAQKYYKNFNDPDLKIMMEYTKTDDGKQMISASGVMEAIRQNAVNNLVSSSDTLLNMVGLPANNIKDLKYRRMLMEEIPNNFGLMSAITSAVIDEWMTRNRDKITLQLFRTSFLKTMSVARGINKINKDIDSIVWNMTKDMDPNESKQYNKMQLRKYIYLYVLGNIYISSKDVI